MNTVTPTFPHSLITTRIHRTILLRQLWLVFDSIDSIHYYSTLSPIVVSLYRILPNLPSLSVMFPLLATVPIILTVTSRYRTPPYHTCASWFLTMASFLSAFTWMRSSSLFCNTNIIIIVIIYLIICLLLFDVAVVQFCSIILWFVNWKRV